MRFMLVLGILAGGALASTTAVAADFTVTAQCCTAYVINGSNNPTLTLTRGHTYTFDVSSPGHPFYVKTAQVTGTASTFDTGVTNNGTTAGTVTFAVPTSAPSTLFYQCSVHSPMTGLLTIISPAVPAGGGLAITLAIAAFGVSAFVALAGARRAHRA